MKLFIKKQFIYFAFCFVGLVALQLSFTSSAFAQPVADCNNAVPFCGSASLSFPSSVSTTAPAGPNYGCLMTVPNPTWYYMQVDQSGPVKLHMNGGGLDIDFASWGPFTSTSAGCATIMGGSAPIQSSYSSASTEDFALGMAGGVSHSNCSGPGASTPPAAVAGEYYIVLITNYTNSSGNLSFNQTAGSGSTNCAITQPCQIGNMTASAVCAGTGTTISGTLDYQTELTTGTLTVTSSCGGSQSYPFNSSSTTSSSLTYSFPGGPGTSQNCTVTAEFTANSGCSTTATFVEPNCSCSITLTPATSSICVGGTATITPSVTGGTWTSDNTAVATVSSAGVVTGVTAGTATITYTDGTCSGTSQITVNAPTAPTFTNPGPICLGAPLTLPAPNNGVTGTWSPAANNTTTTTYTFTPTAGTCASTATMQVVVDAQVTPTFTNPGPICTGSTFTLPATSNNGIAGTWSPAVDNTQTTTYTFTPTGATCAVPTTMQVVVAPPITPTFTNPGPICTGSTFTLPTSSTEGITGTWSPAEDNTQTTTYTFTPSAGSCANSTTMQVTVDTQIAPTFAIPDSLCAGTSFTLPTTSLNGFSGTWSPAYDNAKTQTYTFTPNAGQCSSTGSKTINIKPRPEILISTSRGDNLCAGDSLNISIKTNPPGAIIQWTATNNGTNGATSGTGNSIDNKIELVNSSTPGFITYEVTATQNGCSSIPTVLTYSVNPPLNTVTTVTSSSATVLEGETTNLSVTMNPYIPGVLYTWSPSDNLSCVDCPNPIASPDSATCYVVTLQGVDVCPLVDSVCIDYRINCGEIFVPSIFSPNSDGTNDYFRPYGRCLVKIQMSVYDRWGNRVFYTDELDEGWDGTYKGKLMNLGTFVYRLFVTTLYGETEELKGNVTLVR